MYYKFKEEIIHAKSGRYKIISLKKRCLNQVKFIAEQISITYQCRQYPVKDKLELKYHYEFSEICKLSTNARIFTVYARFNPYFKKHYEHFKKHVEELPINEFKAIREEVK
jgi:hypothetical protein